jgi:hypothetical protein
MRTLLLSGGCLLALFGGVAFLFAGMHEIAVGRRPPGALGWNLIRSSRSSQATWSPTRWRRNELQVIVMGFGLFVLAVWAAVALFNERPT